MSALMVGQVWRDNDPRVNREIRIEELPEAGYHKKVMVKNVETGRTTFIDPKRFNPNSITGYTLVSQPSGWAKAQEEKFLKAKEQLHGLAVGDRAVLESDHVTVRIPLEAFAQLGWSI